LERHAQVLVGPGDVRAVVDAGGIEVGRHDRRQQLRLRKFYSFCSAFMALLILLIGRRIDDRDLAAFDDAVGGALFQLDAAPLHGYSALMLALRITPPMRSLMART